MMEAIVFDGSLELGIKEIDDQHRQFVGYINETREAIERGERGVELIRILNKLLDYGVHHFTTEERLLEKWDYPEIDEHRRKHTETASQLFDFDVRLLGDDPAASEAFVQFLSDWLINHIQKDDRHYADFLATQGITD